LDPAFADAQVRELIDQYRPDILWNDICWPTDQDTLFRLFAYYYDKVQIYRNLEIAKSD
jgi:alpha-L-fucosidase